MGGISPFENVPNGMSIHYFQLCQDLFILQHNSLIPFFIGYFSLELFQSVSELIFQNVLLKQIVEINYIVICKDHLPHKARYRLSLSSCL